MSRHPLSVAGALLVAAPLVLAAAAALAAPVTADSLLARHVAWLGGWQTLDEARDVALVGRLEVAGLSGTLRVWQRRDGHARTEYDLKVLRGTEVLAGDEGWELNASGQVEAMGRDKAVDQRRALNRGFGRHLRGEGVTIALAPDEEREGRTWAVLRFGYPDGDAYDLLVDPRTGESVWSRSVEDGRATWTRASDVRTVAGARFAFRQETLRDNPVENQTVAWDSVTVNGGLDDALFARPGAGAGVARIDGGAADTGWIPVDLHMDRWIVLRGEVNGVATDIVLDSGAGMTALDRATAAAAGLQEAGALAAQGTGGTATAGIVEGVTLRIGPLTLGPLTAAVLDLSAVGARVGRPLPAILGKEAFHALVVDMDYPNARIRFHDPAAFRYDGPGRRLPVTPAQDGHRHLQLGVEGRAPVTCALDTGQGGELTLLRHYAEAQGLLADRPLAERQSGGVGGATVVQAGTLRTVEFAGWTLRDVPVAFHTTDVGGAFDTQRIAGNLGAGILKRFRVLFDYGHDCLWLEPGPGLDAPFPRDRTGLQVEWRDGTLEVVFVSPGGPAAAAGWQVGERIIALDGRPVGADWWRVWAGWARAQDGTVARLTLAGGEERTLALRAYY